MRRVAVAAPIREEVRLLEPSTSATPLLSAVPLGATPSALHKEFQRQRPVFVNRKRENTRLLLLFSVPIGGDRGRRCCASSSSSNNLPHRQRVPRPNLRKRTNKHSARETILRTPEPIPKSKQNGRREPNQRRFHRRVQNNAHNERQREERLEQLVPAGRNEAAAGVAGAAVRCISRQSKAQHEKKEH